MSQALYRKYRSRTLDEVLGQDHVTGILRRALKKGKVSHAYLLTGPRGTGKTSVARILAHEINELPYEDDSNHIDIIEIDAASNNGVDDIRTLREKSQVVPVLAKYKVYIIDEIHMLSKQAFNALLKTLEEPPKHVVFILATTDADKLPSTILSRTQQYYFHPISVSVMAKQLINIAKQEGFLLDTAAANLIARQSRGGFRDSISLLDQLSSLASSTEPLTESQVASSLGLTEEETVLQLIKSYEKSDTATILETLNALDGQGVDPSIIANQLLIEARNQLPKKPQFITLIRELIGIPRHPYPDMKLLTSLVNTPPEQKASTDPAIKQVATKVESPAALKSQPQAIKTQPKQEPSTEDKPKKASSDNEKYAAKAKEDDKPAEPVPTFSGEFQWDAFIAEAKETSMVLFGQLSGCDYDFSDGRLTLFAGKPFAKKRLEDVKILPLISEIARKSQGGEIEIIIKSGGKTPKDEQLAAIADMMGGGEEVKLEDMS